MFLESTGGVIELRLNDSALDQAVSRAAYTSPAGQLVIIGDGGWDPATLTLRFRVTSNTSGTPGDGALGAVEALLAAAKTATCLTESGDPLTARTTYLHGLASLQMRPRGTWWEMEITFRPRALDGTQGTGESLTHSGVLVTFGGVALTVEVH